MNLAALSFIQKATKKVWTFGVYLVQAGLIARLLHNWTEKESDTKCIAKCSKSTFMEFVFSAMCSVLHFGPIILQAARAEVISYPWHISPVTEVHELRSTEAHIAIK